MDKFEQSGADYRSKQTRNVAACDQAVALLCDVAEYCEAGIKKFYKAASDWDTPDVCVAKVSMHQVNIRFGLRPGRAEGSVLRGPYICLFATPEGQILLARTEGWHESQYVDPDLVAKHLDSKAWKEPITEYLVTFLREAEDKYLAIRH
jgi:hypothetical protein